MASISVLSYGNPSVTQTLATNNNAMKVAIVNRTKCSPALQIKTNVANNNNNNNSNSNNNNNLNKVNLNAKPLANKRSYNTMAKKQKAQPLSETNTNVMNTVNRSTAATSGSASSAVQRSAKLAKTLKRELPEIDTTLLCRASGGKSKIFPMPLAVARRNARERNRVKQVNNGFAALRDRIPEEVAEAFEAQGNGRGSIKKLSKVETLRMAVEYIRSLERLLEIDTSNDSDRTMNSSIDFQLANESYQLSDTSSVLSTLTPPPSDNISSGSFDETDGLPDITVIEGHQYIRIPGTNTYQLLETTMSGDETSMAYENDENIEPILIQNNQNNHTTLQHLMLQQQQQQLQQQQQQQLQSPPIDDYPTDSINCFSNNVYNSQIHILTPASISPGAYSMQSSTAGLSPALHDATSAAAAAVAASATTTITTMPLNTTQFLTTNTTTHTDTEIKSEEISPLPSLNDSALYTVPLADLPINQQYEGILTLQTKLKQHDDDDDDIDLSAEHALSEESMLEAMNWWNSQQSNTDSIIHDS